MLFNQPFMRDDTFLGVCQSLGDDFGVPPILFRVALAPLLIWNPATTVTAYIACALLIAAAHLIFPAPTQVRKRAAPEADSKEAAPALAEPVLAEAA